MNIIKEYEDKALSNFDILNIIDKKANIVLYPDLYKYKTLDQVLEPYEAAFILFESKPRYGHWTLIFKLNENTVEFFNPYGGINTGFPDESLKYIPKDFALMSNQNIPYLSLLMLKSPYQLSYNEFRMQKHNPNIKTCGRHCCVRFICKYLDSYQYKNLITLLCNEIKLNSDELVTLLTL